MATAANHLAQDVAEAEAKVEVEIEVEIRAARARPGADPGGGGEQTKHEKTPAASARNGFFSVALLEPTTFGDPKKM